jgi:DNA-binding HxlR family transcriptional regulator
MRKKNEKKCPVHAFQTLISGKHKIRIIWNLKDGPMRYNEIKRGLLVGDLNSEEVAARVLSRELKQLCAFGLLSRKDFRTLPPKVEYSLTKAGVSFLPVIEKMHDWGMKYL